MDTFEAHLNQIIDRMNPDARESARTDVEAVARAGVTTVDALYGLLAERTADPVLRSTAAWLIPRFDDARAEQVLVSALDDPALQVRRQAIIGLGLVQGTSAVPRLLQMLQLDAETREVVVCALGEIGDHRAQAPLLALLADPAQPAALRGQAAESLSSIDGPNDVVPALIVALSDGEAEVRLFAAFALAAVGDARALPALEQLAMTDQAHVEPYGTVSDEARDAAEAIRSKHSRK